MQIFVRQIDGTTSTLDLPPHATVSEVKEQLQASILIPSTQHRLLHNGKRLKDSETLEGSNVPNNSTLVQMFSLPGGKPVKVKLMTDHLPCGPEVTINMDVNTPMLEVKRQLAVVTGVPIEHQKVMLSSINQVVMGDKRTNIKFGHCGSSNNFYFAVTNEPSKASGSSK